MEKRFKVILGLVGTILILVMAYSAFRSTFSLPHDWPSADEMVKNLNNKGYNLIENNEINIDDKKYPGRVVIARKKSNFLAGFWTEDNKVAEIVYDYWSKEYQNDYCLRVGTTVYCGTKKALKHGSINLR